MYPAGMKVILICVALCALFEASKAALSRSFVKGARDYCQGDFTNGEKVKVDTVYYPEDYCAKVTCRVDRNDEGEEGTTETLYTCGKIVADEGCDKVVVNATAKYPDCCPQFGCFD